MPSWVDVRAVAGLEITFTGDVATVGEATWAELCFLPSSSGLLLTELSIPVDGKLSSEEFCDGAAVVDRDGSPLASFTDIMEPLLLLLLGMLREVSPEPAGAPLTASVDESIDGWTLGLRNSN
jgi:hypothetical protein